MFVNSSLCDVDVIDFDLIDLSEDTDAVDFEPPYASNDQSVPQYYTPTRDHSQLSLSESFGFSDACQSDNGEEVMFVKSSLCDVDVIDLDLIDLSGNTDAVETVDFEPNRLDKNAIATSALVKAT